MKDLQKRRFTESFTLNYRYIYLVIFIITFFKCGKTNKYKYMKNISPIKKIDKGLAKYYLSRNRNDYIDDNGIGKFQSLCDNNEINDDEIEGELSESPHECILVQFDSNFPDAPKDNEERKNIFIYNILNKIYNDKSVANLSLPNFGYFNWTQQMGNKSFAYIVYFGLDKPQIKIWNSNSKKSHKITYYFKKKTTKICELKWLENKDFLNHDLYLVVITTKNIDFWQYPSKLEKPTFTKTFKEEIKEIKFSPYGNYICSKHPSSFLITEIPNLKQFEIYNYITRNKKKENDKIMTFEWFNENEIILSFCSKELAILNLKEINNPKTIYYTGKKPERWIEKIIMYNDLEQKEEDKNDKKEQINDIADKPNDINEKQEINNQPNKPNKPNNIKTKNEINKTYKPTKFDIKKEIEVYKQYDPKLQNKFLRNKIILCSKTANNKGLYIYITNRMYFENHDAIITEHTLHSGTTYILQQLKCKDLDDINCLISIGSSEKDNIEEDKKEIKIWDPIKLDNPLCKISCPKIKDFCFLKCRSSRNIKNKPNDINEKEEINNQPEKHEKKKIRNFKPSHLLVIGYDDKLEILMLKPGEHSSKEVKFESKKLGTLDGFTNENTLDNAINEKSKIISLSHDNRYLSYLSTKGLRLIDLESGNLKEIYLDDGKEYKK